MAVITTTITPPGKVFSFIGPPGGPEDDSYIPRSELIFSSSDAYTLSGAGDVQAVILNAVFPRGYAYVMLECNFRVQGADADDWDDCFSCQVRDASTGVRNVNAHLVACNPSGEFSRTSLTAFMKTYQVINPLKKALLCDHAADGRLQLIGMNIVEQQAGGNFDFFLRMAIYDLEQARNYNVSSTTPVR